jgi:hypothetical protein
MPPIHFPAISFSVVLPVGTVGWTAEKKNKYEKDGQERGEKSQSHGRNGGWTPFGWASKEKKGGQKDKKKADLNKYCSSRESVPSVVVFLWLLK